MSHLMVWRFNKMLDKSNLYFDIPSNYVDYLSRHLVKLFEVNDVDLQSMDILKYKLP